MTKSLRVAIAVGLVFLVAGCQAEPKLSPRALSAELRGQYVYGAGNVVRVERCRGLECQVLFRGRFRPWCQLTEEGKITGCGNPSGITAFD